jgi:JNK1/MAPK8-associated membrane protein
MVFVFYAFCVITMMFVRPWLIWLVIPSPSKRTKPSLPMPLPSHGKATIYSALYFLPILALLHALLAGLICKEIEM